MGKQTYDFLSYSNAVLEALGLQYSTKTVRSDHFGPVFAFYPYGWSFLAPPPCKLGDESWYG